MGVQHVYDDHAEIASVWVGLMVTCSKITPNWQQEASMTHCGFASP